MILIYLYNHKNCHKIILIINRTKWLFNLS
nr:MAG TPA: hypothetical protein [Ackermannviridae sp.]